MAKNETIETVATNLRVILTNGAPLTDRDHYPNLKPYNVVTVYGRPGQKIVADSTGAKLLEADPGGSPFEAKDQIGESGYTSFHVYMDSKPTISDDPTREGATLTISDRDDPTNRTDVKGLTFRSYSRNDTNTAILGYARNSGAPADGETPCSVYVAVDLAQITNDEYKYVTVTLLNARDAWISGYGHKQSAKVPLNDDGTATANIVSNAVQSDLKIQMSTRLPADEATVTMSFVALPASR